MPPPPGVVVVKRARRRPFAVLWSVPAWLGALFAGRRVAPPLPPGPDPGRAARRPRLVAEVGGAHRCTGCGECVPVCPARCLDVAASADSEAGVSRLTLEEGACIGCGRCIERCPEGALETAALPAIAVAAGTATLDPFDLLAESARRGGALA